MDHLSTALVVSRTDLLHAGHSIDTRNEDFRSSGQSVERTDETNGTTAERAESSDATGNARTSPDEQHADGENPTGARSESNGRDGKGRTNRRF